MIRTIGQYRVRVASDVVRDGLGIELWDDDDNLVAEIFRCDANHTVTLNTFTSHVPLNILESAIKFLRERLEPFEDGSLLPEAEPMEIQ